VVARGAGTGLSGGATPIHGGIVIATTRMDKVLEVDTRNKRALVQPGVINWELSQHLANYGYAFMRTLLAKKPVPWVAISPITVAVPAAVSSMV
jgi:FAD/FMN-containing dehydrogenase